MKPKQPGEHNQSVIFEPSYNGGGFIDPNDREERLWPFVEIPIDPGDVEAVMAGKMDVTEKYAVLELDSVDGATFFAEGDITFLRGLHETARRHSSYQGAFRELRPYIPPPYSGR